uniref:Uncharacterized protein n=1 Tax=Knipowitschia caucasica TaxID=637954 RepID=A0AAV2M6B4_KNICA
MRFHNRIATVPSSSPKHHPALYISLPPCRSHSSGLIRPGQWSHRAGTLSCTVRVRGWDSGGLSGRATELQLSRLHCRGPRGGDQTSQVTGTSRLLGGTVPSKTVFGATVMLAGYLGPGDSC